MSGGGSGAADSGSYMASGSETILQGGLAGALFGRLPEGRRLHSTESDGKIEFSLAGI